MKARTANNAHGLQDELADFLDDIVSFAREKTGLDAERLEELKQGFRDRVDQYSGDATGAVRDAAEGISGRAEEALEHVEAYAHENPWHLVLAAGLVGLAVGVLVMRR